MGKKIDKIMEENPLCKESNLGDGKGEEGEPISIEVDELVNQAKVVGLAEKTMPSKSSTIVPSTSPKL